MPKLTPKTVEDDVIYDVVLLKPIQVGRTWLRPGEENQMKGRAIKEHADDIELVRELS